jgi:hypothetical protein
LSKIGKPLVAVLSSMAMAAGLLLVMAAPASATYGQGAQYQVELSVNIPGRDGGGVWLWIGLNKDGSADWAGSDCGHGGKGAASDVGDGSWHYLDPATKDTIVIDNVPLNGLLGFPSTITVPATRGHYTGTDEAFMTLPSFIPSGIGSSQLQVAVVPPNNTP